MTTMPVLPVKRMIEDFTDLDGEIVHAAFTTRGVRNKDDGYAKLRSNKPFKTVETFEQGCANYVWRMLCFDLVGWGKHACMPVSADFELYDAIDIRYGAPGRADRDGKDERRRRVRELMVELDELTKRAESALPIEAKKGLLRWGRVLGVV